MVKMTQPKLYTRGKKLWVRFSLDGKVIKKSLNIEDSKANRKLAETQIIPQMLLKVHSGEFFENKTVPTVKEMIDISLKMHSSSRKEQTRINYDYVIKYHILPYFGKKKITSLKASELTLWQNDLLKKFSPKYVSNIRVVFHGILQDAFRDEIINKNPLTLMKSPSSEPLQKVKPFSKEEIFSILNTLPSKVRAYFAIGFFTGMRTGEILALKWKNIDFENKTIYVRATRNRGKDSTPKTKSSIRDVDIINVLLPYLNSHLKYKTDSEYLFNTKFKKPFHSANKLSIVYWKKALKELCIEYRNLYQMRHTFASLMISNGEDILWVSNMLGHKNANITLSFYAKYIKNDEKTRGSCFNT